MNYRHLSLRCHCGQIPDRIARVGFTEDHSLVIHWWCTQCHKVVCVAKSLSDCWRDCPSADQAIDRALPELSDGAYQEEDAEFLRRIGVRA
jgi:hypothetical protein